MMEDPMFYVTIIAGDVMIQNPFPYSDDNKRYYTWNTYLKHTYHEKVFKVALNADFSCPNRDGVCGVGGCTFCGSLGSGECAGDKQDDLMTQFEKGITSMRQKWPTGSAMAYFQAYTNTYAPLSVLKKTFDPFLKRDDVIALCIATRADCLEDDKIAYLHEQSKNKDIWIELGLQTIHDATAKQLNRGHTYAQFVDCVERLSKTNLKICVHLINGLPNETTKMMIDSAKALSNLSIHAVKIHMLHLMKHTVLGNEYQKHPFPLLTREQYVDLVISQLEVLPMNIIIQRLTGDGIQKDLIAPEWTKKKVIVLNEIDKEMKRRNTWQGRNFQK